MKPIFDNTESFGNKQDDSVDRAELDYLLDKESNIVAGRDFFSWETFAPPSKTANRKRYNARLALSPNRSTTLAELSEPAPCQEISEKINKQQTELAESSNFDLSGVINEDSWKKKSQVNVADQIRGDSQEENDFSCDQPEESNQHGLGSELWGGNGDSDEDLLVSNQDIFTDCTDVGEEEVDWLEFAGEADDFEAELTQESNDVDIEGSVTREDRALQTAMEIGCNHDLTAAEVKIIAIIFTDNGWSACREAVNRELNNGTTIAELELAAAIKEIWLEHYEFYSGQQSNYRVLSWPTALKLANGFTGFPAPEEVENLLVRLHQHWRTDNTQHRLFKTFNEYLIDYLNRVEDGFEYSSEWSIAQEQIIHYDIFLPPSTTDLPVCYAYELERALHTIRHAYFYER